PTAAPVPAPFIASSCALGAVREADGSRDHGQPPPAAVADCPEDTIESGVVSPSRAAAAQPASADAHRIQVVLNPAARSGAAAAVREEVARELEARGVAWTRVD